MRVWHRSLERTVDRLRRAIEQGQRAERLAERAGLLQRLDARVKVVGVIALAMAVTFLTNLWLIAVVLAAAVLVAALSHISPAVLAARVWSGVFLFTGTIALPGLFVVPGEVFWRVPLLGWGVSAAGLTAAAYLILRVQTTATLACLLVLTTPWAHVLKALRVLRVPAVFVIVLAMTYRYILLLLEATHDMFESRRSRAAGALTSTANRRVAVTAAGALTGRALYLSGEVHLAMLARGFQGEVHLLDEPRMAARDWAALLIVVAAALFTAWVGR